MMGVPWGLIIKGVAIAAILGLLYWAFIHNPKVIKKLETEKAAAEQQVVAAHNAINLLGNINTAHMKTEKEYEENLRRIRNGRKPSRTGIFVMSGMLPPLFETYSSAGVATP